MFADSLRAGPQGKVVSMSKMLSVFVTVGILSAASVALAAESTHKTTGKIKSVDVMRHIITLEDGSIYKVARGVNIKRMKAGEKVTVTTSKFGGTVEASAITPAVD
jgi:Cu/Ag efflux protein CusF